MFDADLTETPLDLEDFKRREQWIHGEKPVVHLLGNQVSLPRRVYFDFGANSWISSLQWALTEYPVKFDHAYAFEMSKDLMPRIPGGWRGTPVTVNRFVD